jgi:hypothetical protein
MTMMTTTTTTTTTTFGTSTTPTVSSPVDSGADETEIVTSEGLDGGTLGAIIGGCIAGALIIGGIVAFVVFRKRKLSPPAASANAPRRTSEYGSIALKDYDDASSVRAPDTPESNYGSALTNLN